MGGLVEALEDGIIVVKKSFEVINAQLKDLLEQNRFGSLENPLKNGTRSARVIS